MNGWPAAARSSAAVRPTRQAFCDRRSLSADDGVTRSVRRRMRPWWRKPPVRRQNNGGGDVARRRGLGCPCGAWAECQSACNTPVLTPTSGGQEDAMTELFLVVQTENEKVPRDQLVWANDLDDAVDLW